MELVPPGGRDPDLGRDPRVVEAMPHVRPDEGQDDPPRGGGEQERSRGRGPGAHPADELRRDRENRRERDDAGVVRGERERHEQRGKRERSDGRPLDEAERARSHAGCEKRRHRLGSDRHVPGEPADEERTRQRPQGGIPPTAPSGRRDPEGPAAQHPGRDQ